VAVESYVPVTPLKDTGIAIKKLRIVTTVWRTRLVIAFAFHSEKSKPAPFRKTVKDAAPAHQ
jgi:hypothetical protein